MARRAAGDPLFVHEQRPELAGLENAVALRQRALILENLDEFDRPGVLRSVMHLFALRLSTNPQPGFPLTHTLGWSGDGSPGKGSLREFAVGAVVQHMPRSLERVEGRDFRLPTAQELDALEAFQLSLGRREDINADPAIPGHLVFRDANVTAGQKLFHGMPSRQGTRRCGGYHTGGGALNDLGQNEQRATGVSFHANAPACLYPNTPGDGGFGAGQVFVRSRSTFCAPGAAGEVEFRGNQFFSTQSIIEAADTGPFFHNNAAATLEEVVDHYRSDAFNDRITGADRLPDQRRPAQPDRQLPPSAECGSRTYARPKRRSMRAVKGRATSSMPGTRWRTRSPCCERTRRSISIRSMRCRTWMQPNATLLHPAALMWRRSSSLPPGPPSSSRPEPVSAMTGLAYVQRQQASSLQAVPKGGFVGLQLAATADPW